MKLNPGGLFLGLGLGGIATYLTFQKPVEQQGSHFFDIIALVIGAIIGNFLWDLAFKKKE